MAVFQGRWATTDVQPGYSAIVVPEETGESALVWALAHDLSQLVKARITGDAQAPTEAEGLRFDLTSPQSAPDTLVSARASIDSAVSPTSLTLTSMVGEEQVTLERIDRLEGRLEPAAANGEWRADFEALQVNWTVSDGLITGSSTAGCLYSGSTTSPAGTAVYRLAFDEVCGTTTRRFEGIATVDAERARMTVLTTTPEEQAASALMFVRLP
ncbi:hypothetical protein IAI53_06320 [Thauera sp. CAU 1555]|uniref:Uncharacterized protein n=1 Tax=Thauera sedimentorum TaxID=2767595 RepID=A0ABR9B816_9RHOO|nr:hypothetical protein [Thauera sedimentorum]MBC9071575.1 hypothetical protein [Thauera sedimentorum]MBD8502494.1 hypothetical protein [Thauera sedimentorum]